MHAPSVTNTFFTSHIWLWPLSTDVFGRAPSAPYPLVNHQTGRIVLLYCLISVAPIASSISVAVTTMSFCMFSSFSLYVQLMRSAGIPHAVNQILVDRDVILVSREHFAEAAEVHLPRPRSPISDFLNCRAEARHLRAALPPTARPCPRSHSRAGNPSARFHVAETGHIDRIRPAADLAPILRPRKRADAPPSMMWSIRFVASSPLVLPSPFGNSAVAELRRMRVDSSAEAQRKTTFALT